MTVDADLRHLADEIEQRDPNGADRLRTLAGAVSDPILATKWTGVDVLTAIDAPSIGDQLRRGLLTDHSTARLEQLRNVLVLIPLLLTWLGLMYASFGYRMAVTSQPELANEPFLLLWERQFDGLVTTFPMRLLNWATLGVIALLDVSIILVLIVITFVIHRRLADRRAMANGWSREIEAKIRQAAWQASLVLADRHPLVQALSDYQSSSSSLAAELRAERMRQAELTERREREYATLTEVVAGFQTGAKDLGRYHLEVRANIEALTDAADELSSQTRQMSEHFRKLEPTFSSVGRNLKELAQQTRDGTARLDATSQLLIEAVNNDSQTSAKLMKAMQSIEGELQSLAQQLANEHNAYHQAADAATMSAGALSNALDKLPEIVSNSARSAAEAVDITHEFAASATILDRAAREQGRAAAAIQAAADQLTALIERFANQHYAPETSEAVLTEPTLLEPPGERLAEA